MRDSRVKDVLSLFDGISCGQLALNSAHIAYDRYFASEINRDSIRVTENRFPGTIQVGDVRFLKGSDFPNVNMLIGGSPCQNFSMCGTRKGMVTKTNIIVDTLEKYLKLKSEGFQFHGESYLFWEFVRLKKEINPEFFFLENVRMNKKWEKIISAALGIEPIVINSSSLTAQNRVRLYWTNIPLSTITDIHITLGQVIPDAVSGAGLRGVWNDDKERYVQTFTVRPDNKANCVVCSPYNTGKYVTTSGEVKMITPEDAELLQSIQAGYTKIPGISKTARYEMVGNAWTVNVISKFFENLMIETTR